jgi:hypothetical protein
MGWRTVERIRTIAATGLATLAFSALAFADVEIYEDFSEWGLAAGDYATLDFTGFEQNEVLFDQYSDLGVLFPTPNAYFRPGEDLFPTDNWGATSTFGPGINLAFDSPQQWIAADFPGDIAFRLYSDGAFVEEIFILGGGFGNFGGIVADGLFDRVEIIDPIDGFVSVDNVYFGVPAPGALGLFAISLLRSARRRRPA